MTTSDRKPSVDLLILFQDAWLVAVDKPAGMLVHAGREPEPAAQVAMKVVRDRLDRFVYTIHRLDRPTSGVLLFALDPEVQRAMQGAFRAGRVTKTYRALVRGEAPDAGTIDLPLTKSDADPALRPCCTRFRRLSCPTPGLSLLEVKPATGRMHQIRRHLQAIGHPIVGDYLYGEAAFNERVAAEHGVDRMMLMAHALAFAHPVTQEALTIAAPLAEAFRCATDSS